MPSAQPRHGRPTEKTFMRRRIGIAVGAVFFLVVGYLSFSLGTFLVDPAYGTSAGARGAEWVREHGGGSIVTSIENWWYTNHPPAKGGKPAPGSITQGKQEGPRGSHLPAPANIVSPASPALPGEGTWTPVGNTVDGLPAILKATVRVDAIHTSDVAAVAWMDTTLLKASLYSGSFIPGGGPYSNTAPIKPLAAKTTIAAFNAGFRMGDANGGYYTDHKTILPLRNGAASYVIYEDGSSTIGMWGRDVTMTDKVQAVRQNLDLIVDGGKPVPGLSINNNSAWGKTLGGGVYVWRSGYGITATGALVYVGGPNMSIVSLADLLVRAGAIRAMELDINTDWVQYSTYRYAPAGAANGADGTSLLPNMVSSPARYFTTWFNRDFIVMQARPQDTAPSTTTTVTP